MIDTTRTHSISVPVMRMRLCAVKKIGVRIQIMRGPRCEYELPALFLAPTDPTSPGLKGSPLKRDSQASDNIWLWYWVILPKAGFSWPVTVAWDGSEVVFCSLRKAWGWGIVNLSVVHLWPSFLTDWAALGSVGQKVVLKNCCVLLLPRGSPTPSKGTVSVEFCSSVVLILTGRMHYMECYLFRHSCQLVILTKLQSTIDWN